MPLPYIHQKIYTMVTSIDEANEKRLIEELVRRFRLNKHEMRPIINELIRKGYLTGNKGKIEPSQNRR